MNKSCAKCQKTVYPLEELKCLDKIWHKGCFKCHECGMTLNMKTYKGFNKLPYCEAHIPKAKATTVAETPELKRIQENTKIQSNAAYHAEFEKSKGKFTAVSDDPELLRIKQNSKIISNVAYHGDLEKKAIMEQKRILSNDADQNKNGIAPPRSPSYLDEIASLPTPQPMAAAPVSQQSHHHQQPIHQHQYGPTPTNSSYNSSRSTSSYRQEVQQNHARQQQQPHHQAMTSQQQQHQLYQQQQLQQQQQQQQQQQHQQQQQQQHQYQQHLNHGSSMNASPYSSRGQPNVIYSSEGGAINANASRKVGSIADYDPVNDYYGSLDPQRAAQSGRVGSGSGHGSYGHGGHGGQARGPSHHQQQPPPQQPPMHRHHSSGACYRALYDYEAQDSDEVSFSDGDLIVDCSAVDEGWLTGTIQRTGKRGMLPANYVAPAN